MLSRVTELLTTNIVPLHNGKHNYSTVVLILDQYCDVAHSPAKSFQRRECKIRVLGLRQDWLAGVAETEFSFLQYLHNSPNLPSSLITVVVPEQYNIIKPDLTCTMPLWSSCQVEKPT